MLWLSDYFPGLEWAHHNPTGEYRWFHPERGEVLVHVESPGAVTVSVELFDSLVSTLGYQFDGAA